MSNPLKIPRAAQSLSVVPPQFFDAGNFTGIKPKVNFVAEVIPVPQPDEVEIEEPPAKKPRRELRASRRKVVSKRQPAPKHRAKKAESPPPQTETAQAETPSPETAQAETPSPETVQAETPEAETPHPEIAQAEQPGALNSNSSPRHEDLPEATEESKLDPSADVPASEGSQEKSTVEKPSETKEKLDIQKREEGSSSNAVSQLNESHESQASPRQSGLGIENGG